LVISASVSVGKVGGVSYVATTLRNFQDPGVNWQGHSTVLAFVGGLLVGVVVVSRYIVTGKITGISGFLSRGVKWDSCSKGLDRFVQELTFIGGLICAGGIAHVYLPDCFEDWSSLPTPRLVLGGFLVGFGSVLGNGCTSGHGISSLSNLRARGLVATCCFMLSAIVTALSTNTGSYLPYFNNTLPQERSGAVVGVCIGACLVLVLAARHMPPYLTTSFTVVFNICCGIVFGLAMAVTNMSKLSATISFLDLRYWNPALAFVMAGGIFVSAVGFFVINKTMQKPLLNDSNSTKFWRPDHDFIDAKLVVGSLIFGIGWGLAGACPGPALVNVGSTNIPPLIYAGCLVAGMLCEHLVDPFVSPSLLSVSTKSSLDHKHQDQQQEKEKEKEKENETDSSSLSLSLVVNT